MLNGDNKKLKIAQYKGQAVPLRNGAVASTLEFSAAVETVVPVQDAAVMAAKLQHCAVVLAAALVALAAPVVMDVELDVKIVHNSAEWAA